MIFHQSEKVPYNFVGSLNHGLKNAESLEIVISATKSNTISFLVYPHYKAGYINIQHAQNNLGLMRTLLQFNYTNFMRPFALCWAAFRTSINTSANYAPTSTAATESSHSNERSAPMPLGQRRRSAESVARRISTVKHPVETEPGPSAAVIKDAWYVCSWSGDLGHDLIARRIADEPMALYRTPAGRPVAMADRCPHRHYLLSLGKLVGDAVQCGYHGFTFDPSGRCTFVPGQAAVPGAASVRTYPIVERDGAVWVFPGDPARADPAQIPATPWIAEWNAVTGYARIGARVVLLIDNLMDLSHETYLHPSQIGTPEVAQAPIETSSDGNVVRVTRQMLGVECPPFYRAATGITSRIDRSQEIAFHAPAFWALSVRIAPAGDPGTGFRSKVLHGLTPETAHSSHDFWCIVRESDRDDRSKDEQIAARQTTVLMEDVVALEALEAQLQSTTERVPEISIGIDRGGLLARRALLALTP